MKTIAKIEVVGLTTIALLLAALGVAAAVSPPAPTAPGGNIDQRIAQRKAERGIVLTKNDSDRLVAVCTNTQGELRIIQTDDVPMLDKRNKVYGKIDAKIWIAIGELKLAGKDTFQLEKDRISLADKVAAFKNTENLYKQSLDDAILINCKADPAGFKSMLDTTRIYHDQLRDQAGTIRDFVINTIKPELQNFVNDLEPKSAQQENN